MVILQIKGGRVEVLWKSAYIRTGDIFYKTDKSVKIACSQLFELTSTFQALLDVGLLEGVVGKPEGVRVPPSALWK